MMPVISGGSKGVVFWLLFGAFSPQTGSRSHLSSVSQPSRTWPKTVCILFKCGCCSYKIKNCDWQWTEKHHDDDELQNKYKILRLRQSLQLDRMRTNRTNCTSSRYFWAKIAVPYRIRLTLLVFGPLFAIESLPRRSCLLFGWNSSGNVTSSPQIEDFFPVTWAVSPPCIMKPRMFRWNIVPLYFPAAASARKLKAVRGHVSQ